jgi:hypothetical protein
VQVGPLLWDGKMHASPKLILHFLQLRPQQTMPTSQANDRTTGILSQ